MTRVASLSVTRRGARPVPASPRHAFLNVWAPAAILFVALLWSYWPVVTGLWREWQHDPNYSVGQLVPLAALGLAWTERRRLRKAELSPSIWGWLLLGAAFTLRAAGVWYLFESAERLALVVSIAGLVLLVWGKAVFRIAIWLLLFLVLMLPLPGRLHNAVSGPLQQYATASTVFLLELAGITVTREGAVLVLNDAVEVGVVEACSGLRMLTAFTVVAAVLAYLVARPAWQKALLIAFSVPIAVFCNLVRLFVTACLYLLTNQKTAEVFFHDFAGVMMMPLALLLSLGLLWLLRQLVTPDPKTAVAARR